MGGTADAEGEWHWTVYMYVWLYWVSAGALWQQYLIVL